MNYLTVFEYQQGGNACYSVFGSKVSLVVHIDFADFDFALVFFRNFFAKAN